MALNTRSNLAHLSTDTPNGGNTSVHIRITSVILNSTTKLSNRLNSDTKYPWNPRLYIFSNISKVNNTTKKMLANSERRKNVRFINMGYCISVLCILKILNRVYKMTKFKALLNIKFILSMGLKFLVCYNPLLYIHFLRGWTQLNNFCNKGISGFRLSLMCREKFCRDAGEGNDSRFENCCLC